MIKTILAVLTAAAALTIGLQAQDLPEGLYQGMPSAAPPPEVPAPVAADPALLSVPQKKREWLVMVFINGVNDLGLLGYADRSINEMEQVGSSAKVAVVVEYGIMGLDGAPARNLRFQRGSRTILVARDSDESSVTSPPFYSSSDTDMGSAANLVRFVKRASRRFPARKTAVIIWNHGAGRLGIAYDDVSKNHMEVDQLGGALAQIRKELGRKIDVFATDACLMQMAGVVYELRDSAEIIVGSEEIVPLESYPYREILGRLAADPGMGSEGLAGLIVDAYGARYKTNATLSAIRSSAMPGFLRLLNTWVRAVKEDPASFATAASEDTVYDTFSFSMRDSKDLYDYLSKVSAESASPAVKKASGALQRYITGAMLVRDSRLPSMPRAHGLAIYIPKMRYNSANYEKLAFARDSLWDYFLRDMMEERLKP